jgi:hypothetical protein
MKQLMQFIQSLPLTDFCHFLRFKKNFSEHPLIATVLQFHAKAAGLDFQVVQGCADPLAPQLKQFSNTLTTNWQASRPRLTASTESKEELVSMTEDDRLNLTTAWFQVYAKECAPDIQALLSKLKILIDVYTDNGDGYSANVLTSLFVAVSDLYNNKKDSYLSYVTWQRPQEIIPPFAEEPIFKVYGALFESSACVLANRLMRHDVLCRKLQDKIDEYIEDYTLTIVVAMQGELSIDDVFAMYPDFCKATEQGQHLLAMKAVLYDSEKPITARLEQFKALFAVYQQTTRLVGNATLDADIAHFKAETALLCSGNSLAQQSLFSASLAYLPQWPAAMKPSVLSAKMLG